MSRKHWESAYLDFLNETDEFEDSEETTKEEGESEDDTRDLAAALQ